VQASLKKAAVFNYPGSLTTPGCAEPVNWWVVQTPLVVSEAEFAQIQTEFKRLGATDNGKNARPVQPINQRIVLKY
jgi:carbonic anhydrase